jgi:Ser/Thr protein kinase RdoA (MazF antagonist)
MERLAADEALEGVVRTLAARATTLPPDSPDLLVTRMQGKDAWCVEGGLESLVLKRYRPLQHIDDVRWEHQFLSRLAETGFRAPVPLPVFDGESWCQLDGRTWGVLTFVPGRSLMWEPAPGVDAVGALLAEYHAAVRGVPLPDQRPTATPVCELGSRLHPDSVRIGLDEPARARDLTDMLAGLDDELRTFGVVSCERIVVHGDATTDNMVIDGWPPRLVGLIDFGSAYVEHWPADLGAALWRSGRAHPGDVGLSRRRVSDLVLGYHRRFPLTPALASAVPTLIKARGLQLFVRRTQQLSAEQLAARRSLLIETYERTRWVRDHQRELEAAITDAL